jgi:hypothetical protein
MRVALLCLLLLAVGCAGYPRYTEHRSITPEEQASSQGVLTTDECIEFGLILRKYLGKPYKGNSKYQQGMDCSGFTSTVFKEFNGTILPRTAADQAKTGDEVHVRRLQYADLVFFRIERGKISHVGIFIGGGEFIHASESRGVVIDNMSNEYWADRFAGARRVLK